MKKMGLIQTKGFGDILIAIPIAHYYRNEYQIVWPVNVAYLDSLQTNVSWVKWVGVELDPQGRYFYEEPMRILGHEKVDEIICLYQSLTTLPDLSKRPWFQIQKFDECKYTQAGVPFVNKWTLANCITRDPGREQELFQKVVNTPEYFITHLEGSDFTAPVNLSGVPKEWQHINITPDVTSNIFDWLTVIEKAQAVICVDSVFANLIDQMQLDVDKYWIPRSHIHLTPVLGSNWTILEPPEGSLAAREIFRSC